MPKLCITCDTSMHVEAVPSGYVALVAASVNHTLSWHPQQLLQNANLHNTPTNLLHQMQRSCSTQWLQAETVQGTTSTRCNQAKEKGTSCCWATLLKSTPVHTLQGQCALATEQVGEWQPPTATSGRVHTPVSNHVWSTLCFISLLREPNLFPMMGSATC